MQAKVELSIIATLIALSYSMPQKTPMKESNTFTLSAEPNNEHSAVICDGRYFSNPSDAPGAIDALVSYCDNNGDVPPGPTYITSGSVEAWICNYAEDRLCNGSFVREQIGYVQQQCGPNQGGWHSEGNGDPGNSETQVYGYDPAGTGECYV